MEWDGMGWDGMGWDVMGWDMMRWVDGMDGMGWDRMGWDFLIDHSPHGTFQGQCYNTVRGTSTRLRVAVYNE